MNRAVDSSKTLTTLRFEYKYQLDIFEYRRVRNALSSSTRPDRYSLQGRDGRYFVRSLYFDTFDFQAYQEKVTGIPNRIKLRIRSYATARKDASAVKIELKTRTGACVGKFSEQITLDEYDHFLAARSWIEDGGPVAAEFRRLALLKDLRPKVLVDYQREALIPRNDSDVRITFDHHMRFAQSDNLFPRHCFAYTARPKLVVMEVKVRDEHPTWLHSLTVNYGLKSVPNSKYAWAIEQTQHAMYR